VSESSESMDGDGMVVGQPPSGLDVSESGLVGGVGPCEGEVESSDGD